MSEKCKRAEDDDCWRCVVETPLECLFVAIRNTWLLRKEEKLGLACTLWSEEAELWSEGAEHATQAAWQGAALHAAGPLS